LTGIRIVVSWPSHPAYFALYLVLFFPILLIAPSLYGYLFAVTGVPSFYAVLLGSLVLTLSLVLSPINVVVREIETGPPRIRLATRYVFFMGFYVPIVRPEIVREKVVIALNAGGAIIPLFVSGWLLVSLASKPLMFAYTVIVVAIVSGVTYAFSRAVPGVGILVPSLIPPLTSVVVTLILVDNPLYAVPIAYIGGTLGSLIGADIVRLYKSLRRLIAYGATMVSIGGAGTFDGIYLSGLFAILFTMLLTL
jgi:uncharacterized membrane protein